MKLDPHQRAYLIELMAEQAIKDRQRNREQTAFNKWKQAQQKEHIITLETYHSFFSF